MTALIASRLTLSYPAEGRPTGLSLSLCHASIIALADVLWCLMLFYLVLSCFILLYLVLLFLSPCSLALACVSGSAARWAAVVRGLCACPCLCAAWPALCLASLSPGGLTVWVCGTPVLYACPCPWWPDLCACMCASISCPI